MPTDYEPYDAGTPAKRHGPRALTLASAATPAINTNQVEYFSITALAVAITGFTITGTQSDGQRLSGRIKDNGTARAITWGNKFEAGAVALPTTTVQGKTLYVEFVYDAADGKFACERAASRA